MPGSRTRSAADALLQTVELGPAAEDLGLDGAFVRVHHFEGQLSSPFPLLAAMAARTSRIEIGTGVIDMRYENPLYMAEEAAATDLISGGRLQLGVSRGSPEIALNGAESFGYQPAEGQTAADAARAKTEIFLAALRGAAVATTDPERTGGTGRAGHPAAVAGPGRPDLVGLGHPVHRDLGRVARPEPAELHAADRGHGRAVRPAAGRADPALPGGLGRARLGPHPAGVGVPQRAAGHHRRGPGLLRRPRRGRPGRVAGRGAVPVRPDVRRGTGHDRGRAGRRRGG